MRGSRAEDEGEAERGNLHAERTAFDLVGGIFDGGKASFPSGIKVLPPQIRIREGHRTYAYDYDNGRYVYRTQWDGE